MAPDPGTAVPDRRVRWLWLAAGIALVLWFGSVQTGKAEVERYGQELIVSAVVQDVGLLVAIAFGVWAIVRTNRNRARSRSDRPLTKSTPQYPETLTSPQHLAPLGIDHADIASPPAAHTTDHAETAWAVPAAPGDRDDRTVEYQTSTWSDDDREWLTQLLLTERIPHQWVDGVLTVNEEHESLIDQVLENAGSTSEDPQPAERRYGKATTATSSEHEALFLSRIDQPGQRFQMIAWRYPGGETVVNVFKMGWLGGRLISSRTTDEGPPAWTLAGDAIEFDGDSWVPEDPEAAVAWLGNLAPGGALAGVGGDVQDPASVALAPPDTDRATTNAEGSPAAWPQTGASPDASMQQLVRRQPLSGDDIATSLRRLKALHEDGILTDDEYETKRQALAALL